jgi:lipopolysaccharide/colanic/teichoic acid biosynthesis glycosyltransferase
MSEPTLLEGSEGELTPGRAPTIPSWLVGFHGAVQASHLDADAPMSLRSLALAHKSLGTQPLSVLTDLPSLRNARAAPRARNGFRPVGGSATSMDENASMDEAEASAGLGEFWDETEPLATYLDRRLLKARVLYLPNRGRLYHLAKRLMDIVGALVLLVLTSPVTLALAVLIRLNSPGPAVFRQQRVTLGGRPFTFYKFRTMWVDARERYPELYDYRRTGRLGEIYYKLEDDPRNTGVGRWLRRTTLDELPNLVNVLKGDMSLVGPRPELPQLISHYRAEDLALFFTKAGLTGLAQIAGRSLLTVRERITLDLRYVAQQTLILDIRILLRTVLVVVLGRGAF